MLQRWIHTGGICRIRWRISELFGGSWTFICWAGLGGESQRRLKRLLMITVKLLPGLEQLKRWSSRPEVNEAQVPHGTYNMLCYYSKRPSPFNSQIFQYSLLWGVQGYKDLDLLALTCVNLQRIKESNTLWSSCSNRILGPSGNYQPDAAAQLKNSCWKFDLLVAKLHLSPQGKQGW